MALRIVTPPAALPVSLVEAKAHLRLEEDVDDTYVTALIDAARVHVEKVCQRALVLQTVELVAPPLSGDSSLMLPGGRLADTPAVSVHYKDSDGVEQELDAASFFTVDGGEARPGSLFLEAPTTWPVMSGRPDALRVRYSVGWANAAAVPAPLRHAVLLLVSQLYEHRTPEVTGTVATRLELAFDALLSPFRFVEL